VTYWYSKKDKNLNILILLGFLGKWFLKIMSGLARKLINNIFYERKGEMGFYS